MARDPPYTYWRALLHSRSRPQYRGEGNAARTLYDIGEQRLWGGWGFRKACARQYAKNTRGAGQEGALRCLGMPARAALLLSRLQLNYTACS